MSYSLNEMEATAKRAARGAGYSWGLAEEASKATRWLCTQGLDGAAELAHVLEADIVENPALHRPKIIEGVWEGEAVLCPLAVGALLSDCAEHLKNSPIEMRNVAVPSMLLPFAARVARRLGQTVSINCEEAKGETEGVSLKQSCAFPAHAALVTVTLTTTTLAPSAPRSRALPAKESWNTLNQFAHRTYAPATEESRKLGAGAGLSDND